MYIERDKMFPYYVVLILLSILAIESKIKQFYRFRTCNVILAGFILILFSGLRYNVGTDYMTYTYNYIIYRDEPLFSTIQFSLSIIAKGALFIYDDPITWIFLMSFMTIGLIIWTIYRKSPCVYLSIFLFIFMGMLAASFNLVKQYAAIAILFAAQDFIVKKKFRWWLCSCMVATTFHVSAIFMVPIYFLVNRKIDWHQFFLLSTIGVIISFCYVYLFDIISLLKEGDGITDITSDIATTNVNYLRVMVNCSPAILYFISKKRFSTEEVSNKNFLLYANMSILNSVLSLASMNSVYLSRFFSYTNIYGVLFMPYLLSKFDRNSRYILTTIILLLYFIFWNYDIWKNSTTKEFQWILSSYF
jgi:transmembrane protein EpsG